MAAVAEMPRSAALRSETAVLTGRLLKRAVRTPMTFVHGLVLPLSFLVTLKVVFGDSITSMTGQDSLYRSLPLVTLISAMSGSSTAMSSCVLESSMAGW